MGIARYILVRTWGLIVTLFLLSVVVFFLMHAIPGGPFDLEGGDRGIPIPQAVREEILKRYELDGPLHLQYINYMKRAVVGDFGTSFSRPAETVIQLIGRTWKVSLQLGIATFILAILLGVTLGILAAMSVRPRRRSHHPGWRYE